MKLLKKKQFSTLKIKVNNFQKESPDASALIHINKYNTG